MKIFSLCRVREVHLISVFSIKLLSFPLPFIDTPPVYVFDTLENFRWLQVGGFISESLLFHWFSSLFLCQHHYVFDVIAPVLRYLQHYSSCLGLRCYLWVLCFYLNFRISFSTHIKNVLRILFWISLISRHFQQYSLFTILSLSSHKHFILYRLHFSPLVIFHCTSPYKFWWGLILDNLFLKVLWMRYFSWFISYLSHCW